MTAAVVDDDSIVCSSLTTIIEATGTAAVIWTALDGEQAVEHYSKHQPDILLIDIQMPKMNGLDAAKHILQAFPNAKILFLTTFADKEYIAQAIALGAKGYLIKQDVSSVAPAIQAVMSGQIVLGAEILQ
ncbi:MAG: response regulator, partial [Bifidobacteriaceae bacterium]|nr:response regulator [Bifidobacteriaceae bacterium]